MSGVYIGLKGKVEELEENIKYIHCVTHNLNLVMNVTVKGVPKVADFVDVVDCIFQFFITSGRRWSCLLYTSRCV